MRTHTHTLHTHTHYTQTDTDTLYILSLFMVQRFSGLTFLPLFPVTHQWLPVLLLMLDLDTLKIFHGD